MVRWSDRSTGAPRRSSSPPGGSRSSEQSGRCDLRGGVDHVVVAPLLGDGEGLGWQEAGPIPEDASSGWSRTQRPTPRGGPPGANLAAPKAPDHKLTIEGSKSRPV